MELEPVRKENEELTYIGVVCYFTKCFSFTVYHTPTRAHIKIHKIK
jgi:hypothetical protein